MIVPLRQCARLISCRAVASDFPFSVGTMQAGSGENVAVTDRACFMLRRHGLVPLQAPTQPLKVELLAGVAVKVTVVPDG